jgi:hypothetical protein
VWVYEGEILAEVVLAVRSPNWRTYSSKIIQPHQTGDWEVIIQDCNGKELKRLDFSIN